MTVGIERTYEQYRVKVCQCLMIDRGKKEGKEEVGGRGGRTRLYLILLCELGLCIDVDRNEVYFAP